MKTVEVEITGVAPLLINRFKDQSEIEAGVKKKGSKRDYGTPREQAESTAYRDEKTKRIWVPSTWITGAIKTVASDYKLSGTRKSVKSVSGGAIFPQEEKLYFKENYKLKDVEIDSRPCVVMRARIMRHRARLENWSVTCTLEIDNEILDLDTVHSILVDAGKRAGLGDFRPQRGGPFGRFQVTGWKIMNKKKPLTKSKRKK